MDMMDTVPRDGWPMRHVKVAPENDQANVSDLLDDMKGGNMDGADAVFWDVNDFILVESLPETRFRSVVSPLSAVVTCSWPAGMTSGSALPGKS